MARPLPATSNPPLHSRLHLCQRPSPPYPPHSISSLPLQKPLPDSWKLLLAGVASSKRRFSTNVSFFTGFVKKKGGDVEELKRELYKAISALDRGADATLEDRQRVDQIASKLEAVNKVKEPLKSELLNGKWELLYTTSQTLLQTQRPRFLRPNGKIFQAINVDTLRAQNMETWPFYNQATANLVPLNAKRVAVKFDFFRIAGLIPIKNPGSGRGQLEITYLDDELRKTRFSGLKSQTRKQGPCDHCGVVESPLWRDGPTEKPVLCNACGSRWILRRNFRNYVPNHSYVLRKRKLRKTDTDFFYYGNVVKIEEDDNLCCDGIQTSDELIACPSLKSSSESAISDQPTVKIKPVVEDENPGQTLEAEEWRGLTTFGQRHIHLAEGLSLPYAGNVYMHWSGLGSLPLSSR